MRYNARKQTKERLGGYLTTLLFGGVFSGMFLFVMARIITRCNGNYSRFWDYLLEQFFAVMVTGLLFCVAMVLFVVALMPPARYYGKILSAEPQADGLVKLKIGVWDKTGAELETTRDYELLVDANCPLAPEDRIIARIKELSWIAYSVEATDGAVVNSSKGKPASTGGFIGFLYLFLIFLFGGMGIINLVRQVMLIGKQPALQSVLWMLLPTGFCTAAVIYGIRAYRNFRKDNSPQFQQAATGYGRESGIPLLADGLRVRGDGVSHQNQLPDIRILDAAGTTLYCIHSLPQKPNGYSILDQDGQAIGTVTCHVMDVERYEVTVEGLHPFSVRRKVTADMQNGNFEVTGIDFTVEGSSSEMLVRDLSGSAVCYLTRRQEEHPILPVQYYDLEAAAGAELNLYLALLAAVIELQQIALQRRLRR